MEKLSWKLTTEPRFRVYLKFDSSFTKRQIIKIRHTHNRCRTTRNKFKTSKDGHQRSSKLWACLEMWHALVKNLNLIKKKSSSGQFKKYMYIGYMSSISKYWEFLEKTMYLHHSFPNKMILLKGICFRKYHIILSGYGVQNKFNLSNCRFQKFAFANTT